jgi:hypothetical protein
MRVWWSIPYVTRLSRKGDCTIAAIAIAAIGLDVAVMFCRSRRTAAEGRAPRDQEVQAPTEHQPCGRAHMGVRFHASGWVPQEER